MSDTPFGPVRYPISEAANDRYWEGAGIDHPARRSGLLYPPMAANLTIIGLQTVAPAPLLHTAQRLIAHRAVTAPVDVVVTGSITDRTHKRGREYLEVTAEITTADGEPLWTSIATFVEAGA